MAKVRFQSIRREEILGAPVVRKLALCDRMRAVYDDSDSTPLRHEVTCKFCLKLLMAAKREVA